MVNSFVSNVLGFKSHMNHNPTEGVNSSCLIIRPLPEEEELEDELFAGPSEEGDPGNENRIVYGALPQRPRRILKCMFTFFKSYLKTHMPMYVERVFGCCNHSCSFLFVQECILKVQPNLI